MIDILAILEEGDLRSVGRVHEVLNLIDDQPDLFPEVIQAMTHSDPGIRMRASDAVEKFTRSKPDFLQPHKTYLLKKVLNSDQQEVRWHLAQIVPRLNLTPKERLRVAEKLFDYLEDDSKIVQANSLQALVDLAWDDDDLFNKVRAEVERLVEEGSPAVSNRAGKLFHQLDDQ
jgi:hypothetical protein